MVSRTKALGAQSHRFLPANGSGEYPDGQRGARSIYGLRHPSGSPAGMGAEHRLRKRRRGRVASPTCGRSCRDLPPLRLGSQRALSHFAWKGRPGPGRGPEGRSPKRVGSNTTKRKFDLHPAKKVPVRVVEATKKDVAHSESLAFVPRARFPRCHRDSQATIAKHFDAVPQPVEKFVQRWVTPRSTVTM